MRPLGAPGNVGLRSGRRAKKRHERVNLPDLLWCSNREEARLGEQNWKKLIDWQKAHRWHPHQLRHNAATEIRREFGVERAKIVLGVRSIDMAELYGERDEALAIEAVSAIG